MIMTTIGMIIVPVCAFIIGIMVGTIWLSYTTRVLFEEAIRQYKKSLAAWRDVEAMSATMRAELAAVRDAVTLTVGMRVN